MKPHACSACAAPLPPNGLNLGSLPLSHDLETKSESAPHRSIPFHLVQCQQCALVQTLEPVPADAFVPRDKGISFSEPEEHLDDLASQILSTAPLGNGSLIGGVSSKDASLLHKLASGSRAASWRIDPAKDTAFHGNTAGVAWIQDSFDPALATRLLTLHGPSDIIVARHFLEHVRDIPRVVAALRALLKPGGHLVLEVPDCGQGIRSGDTSILWEEHHLCFTPATLARSLSLAGLEVVRSTEFHFPNETCLVAIATSPPDSSSPATPPSPAEFDCFEGYVAGFPERRLRIQRLLKTWRTKGRIAIYGAGHHANTFLHALDTSGLVDAVIDDNPNKSGKLMPGTSIPILPSECLRSPDFAACLSSLGFSPEKRVVAASSAFTNDGGSFYSIFPAEDGLPLRWLAGEKLPFP
jgi:SAM-dependent methyltransferase